MAVRLCGCCCYCFFVCCRGVTLNYLPFIVPSKASTFPSSSLHLISSAYTYSGTTLHILPHTNTCACGVGSCPFTQRSCRFPPMTASHMPYYTQPRHETLTAFKIPFFSSNSRVGGFISEGIACKPRSVSPPRTGIPTRAKIRRIAPNLLPVPGCLPAPCRDLKKKERKNPTQPSQSAPTRPRTHGCERCYQ